MEINIRESRLPGIGLRWELDLEDGTSIFVVAERSGRRVLGSIRADGDRPEWTLALDQQRAVAIAALLLGAKFVPESATPDTAESDTVVVDTVEVGPTSPLIGLALTEMTLPDADAIVLAIIDDRTPDLIEHGMERRCQPHDRIVLAARSRRIDEVTAYVQGSEHHPANTV
ncbi:MAG: hypothetical protein ACE367_14390 [Acidimicrobiales bacterium]